MSLQEPITWSEQLPLGLCHGVFKDQFIFRHILGYFFPRTQNLHLVYERLGTI